VIIFQARDIHRFKPTKWNAKKSFVYFGCCIDLDGEEINEMKRISVPIKYKSMIQFCDGVDEFAVTRGYTEKKGGLMLKHDHHVTYSSSRFMDTDCKYITWSGIEYIWVPKNSSLAGARK